MTTELTQDRIRTLYALFVDAKPWPHWRRDFQRDVTFFRDCDDARFRQPDVQEKLWRARGVSSVGPGEAVDTSV